MPVAPEKIWSTEYLRPKLGGATWPSQANGNCQTSFSHARFSVRVGLMLLYPYSYHDQLQLHLSRYRLGMRRYLLSAVVVHKYIPNAASYKQANQTNSQVSPTTANGPPGRRSASKSRQLSVCLCWTGLELQFHVPFGSLLLLALTGSAARIKSLRFHLGTKHRDYCTHSSPSWQRLRAR